MAKTEEKMNKKQGHWILAKVGKKVLRPGGVELTRKMIDHLQIDTQDDVVEFAPGLGLTAAITCKRKPKTYTGVDLNKEAAEIVRKSVNYEPVKIVVADAGETGLPDGCASKVYGEAMLTMQNRVQKKKIIDEAKRLLRKGGMYAIHELGLTPDNIDEDLKKEIEKGLSNNIRVSARPLTETEWKKVLEDEGFKVVYTATAPMHLLEFGRMVKDEGFFRTLKIIKNILSNKEIRQRVKGMRGVFKKYDKHLNGIVLVAEKL
ncbi:class I SAM-dependent methyltransferase [Weeksellaceae bacterium TAE3-ERU29]|nr:class I SAM-dependent methyltransferase [Weeksellaceae bacterium TAE3-ERU29]